MLYPEGYWPVLIEMADEETARQAQPPGPHE